MIRKLLLFTGGLLTTILLLVVGAFAFAQTQTARDQISGVVESQLSGPGRQAEVQGLGGLLPFDVRLGQFRLSDEDGAWLEVEGVRLEVSPTALLRGEVTVREVGAARVAVRRLPAGAPAAEPEPEPAEPFSLPELPQLPASLPRVTVERLFVDRIELAEPVLGEAASFNLTGNATTGPEGRHAQARLSLTRTDEPTAELSLTAGLDLRDQSLAIDLDGSETGGLLAAATGRPEAGALRLSLEGQGPLSNWQGRLTADAERLARLDLGLDLAYADEKRVALGGTFEAAAGALPPDIADVVGTRADVALRAGEVAPQRYALEELRLQAASLSLTGSGSADLAADTIDGSIGLEVPELQRFAGLAGTPLAGNAALRLAASGAATQPVLELSLEGSGIQAATLAVDTLGVNLSADVTAPLGERPLALRLAGNSEATGLRLDGRQLGPDGRLQLDLAGTLPPEGDAVIDRLQLRSALAELTGSARVNRDTLVGTARLDARVPELATVVGTFAPDAAAVQELGGTVELGADIGLGEAAKRIELALNGTTSGLRGLPPGAAELLGPAPTLHAQAVVEPETAAQVQSLALEGAGIRLEGDPRFGFADQSLGGQLRLRVPALAALEPVVGQPIAGTLAADVTLGGTVPQPDVALAATSEALAVAGQSFDRVALDATAAGPVESLAGTARLTAAKAGQEVTLRTGYALAPERVNLSDLALDGPGTRLAGGLSLALDSLLATGRLAGEVQDLAALEPWTGQPLQGAVTVDLGADAASGRQDARLALTARDIAADFGSLGSAQLQASVQDALGRGLVDAQLTASGLATPDLTLAEASVDVDGSFGNLAIQARANGTQAGQPLDLRAAAQAEVLEPRKQVRLTTLEGTLAGQNVRLGQPTTVVLDQGVLDIDQVDLQLGPARVQGSLELGGGRVRADATLDELPLATVAAFGGPALGGTATARLDLSGPTAAPTLTLEAGIDGLALAPDAPREADLTLNARLASGRLTGEAQLAGLGNSPVTTQLEMPASLSLEPFGFDFRRDAAVSGSLRGPVDLANVAAALDGVRMAGTLDLDLGVAGTVDEPRLGGFASLAGGVVEEVTSGISLVDLALAVEAAGNRIVLRDLSARDRAGGQLAGQGAVTLPVDDALAYEAALTLNRARVLDNDLGVVLLSGDIEMDGGASSASVEGRLRVDHADLEIPDATGVSIPTLDVQEINHRSGSTAPPARAAAPFDVALDVVIDAPARLFVTGRGLESEWGGNLRVTGSAAQPAVIGQIEARRGFLDLLDRRFTIREGQFTFQGNDPPMPFINVVANARTAEVTAIVQLTGPALDPKLTLASDPALPQDEVLSRVLFGQSARRITPVQGLRLAAAVRELQGGGGLNDILTAFRRSIGVDTLDVRSGEKPGETTAAAGKYLSDDVFLEVEKGVTPGSGKARVQVELTPNLSVGTEVDETSQTGFGLQWRYDY